MQQVYELKLRAKMGKKTIMLPTMLFDNEITANKWYEGVQAIMTKSSKLEILSATKKEIYTMKSILEETKEFFDMRDKMSGKMN